jgi:hypothetical protein
MLLTPKNKSVALDVTVNVDGWKEAAFNALETQKAEIETEIGTALKWIPLPDKQSARIVWEVALNPDGPENRDTIIKWFVDSAPRFYLAFRDRIKDLQAPSL